MLHRGGNCYVAVPASESVSMTSPSQAPAPVPDADPVPVAPPSLTTPHPLRGLLLMAGGTLLFACNDSVTKILLDHYDVPVVAAVRYIVHTLLLIAIFGATKGPELYGVKRTGLVAVRSICLAVASLFFGLALQRMPMPETTAIVYIAPLAVVLLAGPLLKETIGPLGWIAAALGFGGMLLIVRPGGGLDPLGVLYAFGNIGLSVVYFMLSRVLAHSERTLALLFYSALAGAIIFGIGRALVHDWPAARRAADRAALEPRAYGLPRPLLLHRRLSLCRGLDARAGELCPPRLGRPAGLAGLRPRARIRHRHRHGRGDAGRRPRRLPLPAATGNS